MAAIKFWLDMSKRIGLKETDKLMVGNVDNENSEYIDITDLIGLLGGYFAPIGEVIDPIPVTGISVAPETATKKVNESFQVVPTVTPSNATNKNVIYTSSDPTKATVSTSGLVEPLVAAMTPVTITVTTVDGGFTDTCILTVEPQAVLINSITVTPESAILAIGGTKDLEAAISPTFATNKTLTWTSSNSAVATVAKLTDPSGIAPGTARATAVAIGTATITAKAPDGVVQDTHVITVQAEGVFEYLGYDTPLGSGWVEHDGDPDNISAAGGDIRLRFNSNYSWARTSVSSPWAEGGSNNNNPYISIEENSTSSQRSVTFIYTQDVSGLTQSVTIVQRPSVPVTGVTVTPGTLTKAVGVTFGLNELIIAVLPANATYQGIDISVSNTSILRYNGPLIPTFTCLAPGTADIIVTTVDGGFTDTCILTVEPQAVLINSITVTPESAILAIGGTKDLEAAISPTFATNKTLTWTSSNSAVATVAKLTDPSGIAPGTARATAVAIGTATITAKAPDGVVQDTHVITVQAEGVFEYLGYDTPLGSGWVEHDGDPDNISAAGGDIRLRFNSNYSWARTSVSSPWAEGGSNNNNPYISIEENSTSSQRSVTFIYTQDVSGLTQSVTIVQRPSVPVTGVTVTPGTLTKAVGVTFGLNELIIAVLPANATYQGIDISVSNTSILRYNGPLIPTFTCLAPGTADIIVTTVDGGFTDTCILTVGSPPVPGLKLLLHADALPVTDSSSYNRILTSVGTLTLKAGKFGQAINGATGGVQMDRQFYADLLTSKTFTIEFWIKPESSISNYIVFGSCKSGNLAVPGTMWIDNSQKIGFIGNNSFGPILSTSPLAVGSWTHVVLVSDNNATKLFINGVLNASGTITSNVLSSSPVYICAQTTGSNIPGNFRNALIDEFVLWDTAKYTGNFTPPSAPY